MLALLLSFPRPQRPRERQKKGWKEKRGMFWNVCINLSLFSRKASLCDLKSYHECASLWKGSYSGICPPDIHWVLYIPVNIYLHSEDQWIQVPFRQGFNFIVAEAKLVTCFFKYLYSLSPILVNNTVIFQGCWVITKSYLTLLSFFILVYFLIEG